jgi:hypothetical protein
MSRTDMADSSPSPSLRASWNASASTSKSWDNTAA